MLKLFRSLLQPNPVQVQLDEHAIAIAKPGDLVLINLPPRLPPQARGVIRDSLAQIRARCPQVTMLVMEQGGSSEILYGERLEPGRSNRVVVPSSSRISVSVDEAEPGVVTLIVGEIDNRGAGGSES